MYATRRLRLAALGAAVLALPAALLAGPSARAALQQVPGAGVPAPSPCSSLGTAALRVSDISSLLRAPHSRT